MKTPFIPKLILLFILFFLYSAGCIFNQGQIHGLVHIIIIFCPHPLKRPSARIPPRTSAGNLFFIVLTSSNFYSFI